MNKVDGSEEWARFAFFPWQRGVSFERALEKAGLPLNEVLPVATDESRVELKTCRWRRGCTLEEAMKEPGLSVDDRLMLVVTPAMEEGGKAEHFNCYLWPQGCAFYDALKEAGLSLDDKALMVTTFGTGKRTWQIDETPRTIRLSGDR